MARVLIENWDSEAFCTACFTDQNSEMIIFELILTPKLFLKTAGAVAEIGSILKSNHRKQIYR